MNPSIYIETTIPSYLTARASRDRIVAANQELTRNWWRTRRMSFRLFVSRAVLNEAAGGDAEAAKRRLMLLREMPELDITDACSELGERLIDGMPLPRAAANDALHVAIAAVHGMNYLLTWNCTHIANAAFRTRIQSICLSAGFESPVICTPQELIGS